MKGNIKQIEENTQCPECNSKKFNKDQSRAELVCRNCGLVIDEDLIDYSPEWRAFDKEQKEKKARTGSPTTPLLYDRGLSTTIGWQNKDYYGKSIPTKNRSQIYRIRKWNRRLQVSNAVEQNLKNALQSLDRMCSSLGLPRSIRENSAMIYRQAVTQNFIRGRSIDDVVAASIYAACRKCNIPRTLNEIHKKTNIPLKKIARNYRHLSRELKLKILPTNPIDYLSRFCNKLNLNNKAKKIAQDIIKMAEDKKITLGKIPAGITAASIYMAGVLSNDRKTQKEVSNISGVTEVTIRNHYKEIARKLDIDIAV